MIRISTPYYDKEGNLKGIVILNYSANDMLNQVRKISLTSQGNIFMLNSDAYWIYDSVDSKHEWAFMYEDQTDKRFSNKYKDEWKVIQSNGEGYLISKKGAFIYSNILTSKQFSLDSGNNSLVLGLGDWYIVSYISADTQKGMLFTNNMFKTILIVLQKNYIGYIFIFFISIAISILMTINKIEKDRIKYFSEYDVMTGAYNRRAGFEKLTQLYKNASSLNCENSICFIDINGLKEINDFLGHDAGDELILSVVKGIKDSIREKDFVARLGGDEFLIIFEGIGEEEAESIWNRIVSEYNYINQNENRKYIISVSHGVETFTCNSNEFIDEVINHADEKMYSEKRKIKKDLKVIRE